MTKEPMNTKRPSHRRRRDPKELDSFALIEDRSDQFDERMQLKPQGASDERKSDQRQ